MKLTLILIGRRNFEKILKKLEQDFILAVSDYNVIFLTNDKISANNIQTKINYEIYEFDKYSTENEMIEYLFQNKQLNNILLFKESYTNFNIEDANKMLSPLSKKEYQLIISKQQKKDNFLKRIINKISSVIAKFFIGNAIYQAEADIMFLSSLCVSIIKQAPQKSAKYIKTNNFSGIEAKTVAIPEQDKLKNKNITSKNLKMPISLSVVLMLLLAGNITLAILNISLPFLALLAYILLDISVLGFLIFSILKLIIYKKFGKLNFIDEAMLVTHINNKELENGKQN